MPIRDLYDGQSVFQLPWQGAFPDGGGVGTAGWGPGLTVLMALGMAHRRPLTQQELLLALESLDLPTLPCADVTWGLVRGLVRSGGLRMQDGETLIPGEEAGRLLIRSMMAPLDESAGILRAMVRVRMAFLDLLTPADRVRVLERVLLALEVAAEGISSGFEERWSGTWGSRWILRDLAAATDDIRQVRGLLDEARAADRLGHASARVSLPSTDLLYAAE